MKHRRSTHAGLLRGTSVSPRRQGGAASRAAHAIVEAMEARTLLASSTLVYPSATDGRLIYAPNAAGDVIPDFSQVGYKTGNVPLPNTPGGLSVPVKVTLNPGAAGVDQTTN